jgi:Domain of unknown function DUF29
MHESAVTLYDKDFVAWTHEQAEHLRAKRITKLDYDHLAEEIEALGKRDWRALESHVKILLLHGLKWTYQPQERARRGRGWQTSMDNARDAINQLLRDNPSFQERIDDAMAWAYPRARRTAAKQTGLPLRIFPVECEWTIVQLMNEDVWG